MRIKRLQPIRNWLDQNGHRVFAFSIPVSAALWGCVALAVTGKMPEWGDRILLCGFTPLLTITLLFFLFVVTVTVEEPNRNERQK